MRLFRLSLALTLLFGLCPAFGLDGYGGDGDDLSPSCVLLCTTPEFPEGLPYGNCFMSGCKDTCENECCLVIDPGHNIFPCPDCDCAEDSPTADALKFMMENCFD